VAQYYRRRRLDAARHRERRPLSSNADRAGLRQRALLPLNESAASRLPSDEETLSLSSPRVVGPPTVQAEARPDVPVTQSEVAPEPSVLVQKAASILNEQMAAGVVAAQEAHRSMSRYPSSRSPLDVGAQWRRAAHAWIDTFADWLTPFEGSLNEEMATAVGPGTSRRVGLDAAHEQVPVLRPHDAVRAGGTAQIAFKLHNDDTRTTRIMLYCTDLLSGQGRIPQQHVVFQPQALQLGPDALEALTLQITIPSGAPAGTYSGLLIVPDLPYLRAILTLEVM
jgi:hypothetical protein